VQQHDGVVVVAFAVLADVEVWAGQVEHQPLGKRLGGARGASGDHCGGQQGDQDHRDHRRGNAFTHPLTVARA